MRLEALMTRNKTLAVTAVAAIAVLAAAVGSPIFLLLILVPVALLAILGRRHNRPISADRPHTRRWQRWILAAVASFAVGGAVLALNGNQELSAVPWTVFALSWLTSAILLLYGLVLVLSQRLSRRPA
jgi:uncharacterized membrane protein